MGFASTYLNKHLIKIPDISGAPSGLLRYIVIIPAFSEPEIYKTLESLLNCSKPKFDAEVYILVNYSEKCLPGVKTDNQIIYNELTGWCGSNSSDYLRFYPFLADDLPRKHAGAGLARKLLMDTAVCRFDNLNVQNGYIISLDADTLVPSNYLQKIEEHSEKNQPGCMIFNFAHPLSGNDYPKKTYDAITLYELYLRYYKYCLKLTGFPHYHYTIGSCFAVNVNSYIKVGGMNQRQAGEDFYFLHKVFPNNKVEFIKEIVMEPSLRISDRVPFGTGPALKKITESDTLIYTTYALQSFLELKELLQRIPEFYKSDRNHIELILNSLPVCCRQSLSNYGFSNIIKEINDNCASVESFTKRFYQWFDAFMVIKYLNFARDNYFPSTDITETSKELLKIMGVAEMEQSPMGLLERFRKLDLLE